jgi:tetratricopeptide (TPR) repeat protein
MSHTNLVDYNFLVTKINLVKRGMIITVPLIIIVALNVSSVWAPLNRLLHESHQLLIANDKLKASIALFQAAHYSPRKFELLEQAGILALEAGDQGAAKSYLEQVQDSGEISPAGLTSLGDIARMEGHTQLSISLWEAALNSRAEAELFTKLIMTYRQIGNWDKAIQTQKDLVTLFPNSPEYNYQTGLMLAASQPEAALAYLSLAGEIDSSIKAKTNSLVRNLRSALNRDDQSYPLVIAGQALAAMDEWELALFAFSNAAQENPDNANAWAYLGEALQQSSQDGFEELGRALKIDPDSIAANTLMALYWQRHERYDLALVYLYAAAQLDDNNPVLQAEIGNTLGLLGNIPAAESHYQRAASKDQKDPTYWRSLANYYIRYEIDLKEKGVSAARQAVILAPDDPESLDILAQIYLLQENPILAHRFLDRALAADAEYAPAHLHSGLVNILEGDYLSAYQHFSAAISFSQPDSPTAEQAARLMNTYFP